MIKHFAKYGEAGAVRSGDAGTVTAEFVILVPLVAAILALAISIGGNQLLLMQKQVQLSKLARQIEFGMPALGIAAQARAYGFEQPRVDNSGMSCVQGRFVLSVLGFAVNTERLSACALAPGF